jgi:hypothetical protein
MREYLRSKVPIPGIINNMLGRHIEGIPPMSSVFNQEQLD